jgi:short-subunit dehydrogenase
MLINNAGFLVKGDLVDADLDSLKAMNVLHMEAPLRLCRAALPGMLDRDRGAIVNVSSIAGMVCSPGNINYCATKAYLTHFSEGLQHEIDLAGKKVRVQALCPGFTRTEIHSRAGVKRSNVPDSMWMKAEDVVDFSLRMLKKKKIVVVPGGSYRFLTGLFRLLPRSWVHSMVLAEQKALRKKRAAASD